MVHLIPWMSRKDVKLHGVKDTLHKISASRKVTSYSIQYVNACGVWLTFLKQFEEWCLTLIVAKRCFENVIKHSTKGSVKLPSLRV